MSSTDEHRSPTGGVERLLAAALDTRRKSKLCWVTTVGVNGEPHARVVSPIPSTPQDDEWVVWFLTSKASRKASEIARDPRLTLGYQHEPDSAYVSLNGRAILVDDRAELSRRWNPGWNAVFPTGAQDLDAVFVKVEVEHIELWNLAMKVTPAPFGKCAAVLQRVGTGQWHQVG